ncbi:hypothetical protein Q75_09080 [Bacillus coahuilensis p1.1.43]|uniref:Aminoglycoside/hydroxyurea antibiotic resistance kinase n=1 Tax=Bacillus coahuilensis p1.1.43 TaxID=1150625 RepID=A0A147K812_9BACI|nr:aminoglycoside phosphotransferase family protein [Bacillus coahuilensis]KUP06282.1 hypothetical protein Q75_09080 [Bacillus coahuilensis p1.1.43]
MMIPRNVELTFRAVHGNDKTNLYLLTIRGIIKKIERRFNGRLQDPYPKLSYHFVAPFILYDGTILALKTAPPNVEFQQEILALKAFQSPKFVRLVEYSLEEGWMLLEALNPGVTLREYDISDDEKTKIALSILASTWQPIQEAKGFPHANEWLRSIDTYKGEDIPSSIMNLAKQWKDELLSTSCEEYLLHGDFHQGNILLDHTKGWIGIDPKGIIGEPAFDTFPYLANELVNQQDPYTLLKRRIELLSIGLGILRIRLIQYGFCRAVLSSIWTLEEGLGSIKDGITSWNLFLRVWEELEDQKKN